MMKKPDESKHKWKEQKAVQSKNNIQINFFVKVVKKKKNLSIVFTDVKVCFVITLI